MQLLAPRGPLVYVRAPMSLDNRAQEHEPLAGVDQLVNYFRSGEKPRDRHRVGMEHEKIGFLAGTIDAVPYAGPHGIEEILERWGRFGYEAFLENGKPIAALKQGLLISLEPGGQLELSGLPFHCCNDLAHELDRHLARSRALGAELGQIWLGVGYRPFGTPAEARWVPKGRYARMREHLGQTGRYGLDMMAMTATVQASFDYSDEADMVAKVQMATRVSPLVTALFANSPLKEGRKAGALSFRTLVWREVDPLRCGIRPEFFAPDFGYASYAAWALDVPMIFLRRGTQYFDPRGLSFRRFLADGLDGQRATPSDWEDHLTTLFPEVRLKRVIEMRGADMGTADMCLALPSLWKGLLYDRAALEAATALVPLSVPELIELQESVAHQGLKARAGGRSVSELCRELVQLAAQGLRGQDRCGPDEGCLLYPLREILERGLTPAEQALLRLDGELKGNVRGLLEDWRVA